MKLRVTIDGRELVVEVNGSSSESKALVDGRELTVTPARSSADCEEIIVSEGSRRVTAALVPVTDSRDRGKLRLLANGRLVEASVESERDRLRALARPSSSMAGGITARSTLPGVIRRILRKEGDEVDEGEPILTLEAMKMENEVRAEAKGRVRAILVREGQVVNAGDALAEIDGD